jgi:hypothetical protein
VPYGDYRGLVHHLATLAATGSAGQQLGRTGARIATQLFDAVGIAAAYENLYQSLGGNRGYSPLVERKTA